MNRTALGIAGCYVLLASGAAAQNALAPGLRFWSSQDVTRVVMEADGEFTFTADRALDPDRLFFDISGARLRFVRRSLHTWPVTDRLVQQIRTGSWQPGATRVVFDLRGPVDYSATVLSTPNRLIVELRPAGAPAAPPAVSSTPPPSVSAPTVRAAATRPATRRIRFVPPPRQVRPAPLPVLWAPLILLPPYSSDLLAVAVDPTAARRRGAAALRAARPARPADGSDQTLARVLGLKLRRVVVDAGHGGHDTGTIGPSGYNEKELVLDVALRLGDLITRQLGSEVIYTRSDDTFVPLQDRTRMANDHRADLFISIHANSSPSSSASGVETFFLNLTTDKYALEVAARENAASEHTVHDLPTIVQAIAKSDKKEESRQFAARVQSTLYAFSARNNRSARDRGIKSAPFVVLVGARMPSILCEIGFLSNPKDEGMLRREEHRQRLAEALFKGVSGYANSLSHVQVAVKQ